MNIKSNQIKQAPPPFVNNYRKALLPTRVLPKMTSLGLLASFLLFCNWIPGALQQ